MGTDLSAATPPAPPSANIATPEDVRVQITQGVHLALVEGSYVETQGDRVAGTTGRAARYKPARIVGLDVGFTWAAGVVGADGKLGVWRVGKVSAEVQQQLRDLSWGEVRTRTVWTTDAAVSALIDTIRPTSEPTVTWAS